MYNDSTAKIGCFEGMIKSTEYFVFVIIICLFYVKFSMLHVLMHCIVDFERGWTLSK